MKESSGNIGQSYSSQNFEYVKVFENCNSQNTCWAETTTTFDCSANVKFQLSPFITLTAHGKFSKLV